MLRVKFRLSHLFFVITMQFVAVTVWGVPRNPEPHYPELSSSKPDSCLSQKMETALRDTGYIDSTGKPPQGTDVTVGLVEITDPLNPRTAFFNDKKVYGASIPKIAVMLGIFQKIEDGKLGSRLISEPVSNSDPAKTKKVRVPSKDVDELMIRMIRESNNSAATDLCAKVGRDYMVEVLRNRYRLRSRQGGLWPGSHSGYCQNLGADPVTKNPHSVTALELARFFYLLATNRLISEEWSQLMMERYLGKTLTPGRLKVLEQDSVGAKIFRKSGSCAKVDCGQESFSDSAVVKTSDGRTYIVVIITSGTKRPEPFQHLALKLHHAVVDPVEYGGCAEDTKKPDCPEEGSKKKGAVQGFFEKLFPFMRKEAEEVSTPQGPENDSPN